MNKLFKHVASLTLGLTMAIGVGITAKTTGPIVATYASTFVTKTMNIFGDTGTKDGDTSIYWSDSNIRFTNNKAGSTTAIRTSDTDHYRCYAKSQIVISCENSINLITNIQLTCTGSSYVDALKNALSGDGYTASSSGTIVTVDFTNPTSSVSGTLTAQTRVKQISVTYTGGSSETTYIESLEITNGDFSLPKGKTQSLTVAKNPTDATEGLDYASDNETVATVSDGVVTAVGVGTAKITVSAETNSSISDFITVEVTPAVPEKMSCTKQDKTFVKGHKVFDYFTETSNIIEVTYTDDTTEVIPVSDSGLTLKVGETVITSETIVTTELLDGKTIDIVFTDNNVTVEHGSGLTGISVVERISIESVEQNFVGSKDYLLIDETSNTLTVNYVSYDEQLDLENEVLVGSNSKSILTASLDTSNVTFNKDTNKGSFDIKLTPVSSGLASVFIYISTSTTEIEYTTDSILVRDSEPSTGESGTDKYVKVTNDTEFVDGVYLIVNEDENFAFNGGLQTLDAVNNYITFDRSDSEIAATPELNAATFTISSANGTIKSNTGYFVGQTSNANGLKSSKSTEYSNTFNFNDDGTADIVSGGAYLRFNTTSGQDRFRYYKSSSYTDQEAVCLYKLVESSAQPTTDFDIVYAFVQDYMHIEVDTGDNGTGLCSTAGWYEDAKAAFLELTAEQQRIFVESFGEMFTRLTKWAKYHGETITLNSDNKYEFSNARHPLTIMNSENNAMILVIVFTFTLSTFAFICIARKKRKVNSK